MTPHKVTLSAMLLLASFSCSKPHAYQTRPALRVEIATATIDTIPNQITFTSQIEPLRSATIQPRVEGFLISTHFEGGAAVQKGDLLFTIDPSTYTTSLYAARAELESAKASEILAQRNYERALPLARLDAISQSDIDQYRATYRAAVASTKSAEESLRQAQLEVGYTKIYSPINGVAAESSSTEGDFIGLTTIQNELTTISQLDTITVQLSIPAARYLAISQKEGSSFNNATLLSDINLTLSDSTTYPHQGSYYYTRQQSPSATSSVVIVTRFPNPTLRLKAGMFARIHANTGNPQAQVVVPTTAVSQLQGINSIWVINSDSTAQWRRVALGKRHGSLWAVESGITAGENVVVKGATKLHNGVKVSITKD